MPQKQPSTKRVSSFEQENDDVEKESPLKSTALSFSDSDDDSGSDADSEDTHPSPMTSGFAVKPRDNVTTATPKRKTGCDDDEKIESKGGDNNKNKKAKSAAGGSSVKSQRVWSEDDEIALLKGMSEYRSINGSEPAGTAFYEYIKNSLHLNFELSRNQMVDKIYRLRKKYESNVEKAGDEDPVFAKAHEQKAFELSKKIWGPDAAVLRGCSVSKGKTKNTKPKQEKTSNTPSIPSLGITLALPKPNFKLKKKVNNEGVRANSEVEAKVKVEVEVSEDHGGTVKNGFWSNFPPLSSVLDLDKEPTLPEFWKNFTNERILKGDGKAKELEEEWRDLQEKELELNLKRADILKQEQQLELDLMRASRS